jgi:methyltransferase-like protein
MDFLRNRSFRATLLCHREVSLERCIKPECMAGLHLALEEQAVAGEQASDTSAPVEFRCGERTISVAEPITKAALALLSARWPLPTPFPDLFGEATQRLKAGATGVRDGTAQRAKLAADLLTLASRHVVRIGVDPPPFVIRVSEFPTASPLSRLQALDSEVVTNRRHEQVRLPTLMRKLLPHLDGHRDRAGLADELSRWISRKELTVEQHGQPLASVSPVMLHDILQHALEDLAKSALLIA